MQSRHPEPEPQLWTTPERELREDILHRFFAPGSGFRFLVVVLGLLFLLGVIGFLVRLRGGFEERRLWGYYATAFAFLLGTTQSAPLVAVALRLTKTHWGRPFYRLCELFAAVGVLNVILFLPLLPLLPPLEGRKSIWFRGAFGAPWLWDTLALLFLVLCGLALLYTAALPDLAAAREHAAGQRGLLFSLARHWRGTAGQWRVLRGGLTLLGAFYLMAFVFATTLVSSDFAMSLVPGWRSAIFPAYQAVTGLQGGLAMVIVTMALWRWTGGLRLYLGLDQFWGLAKILLALSLLWFYFWWSEFLTFWYGRIPAEQNLLDLLIFGPYMLPFLLAFSLCFLVPLLALIWNPVRKSILGPSLVALGILVGLFFDRMRLFVAAFSIQEVPAPVLEHSPPTIFPEGADLLIILGALAGVALCYLLASRLVPLVSLWEMREGLRLWAVRSFLRRRMMVIAKPD